MKTLRQKIEALPSAVFMLDGIQIRPIRDDNDLWYAVVECQLAPGQEDYVNPAGFSIGRAYLHPEDNIPCVILNEGAPIGYIVLRECIGGNANSWSYYLDKHHQGKGFGKKAARLAIQILKAAEPMRPIKLSAEQENAKAHRLYQAVGFCRTEEMDGDDLVFIYK